MPRYRGSRLPLLKRRAAAVAALGTPSWVATATIGPTNGLSITCNVPTHTNGDCLIAVWNIANTTATLTPPSGWNFIAEEQPGGTARMRTYWRVASGEPADYAFALTPSITHTASITSFTDTASSSPIDGAPSQNGATSATLTGTTITTSNNNTMLVLVGDTNGARTYTDVSMTERSDVDSQYVGTLLQVTAGASGSKTATISSSGTWRAQLIGIKPLNGV